MNSLKRAAPLRPHTTLEVAESAERYMTEQINPVLCRELADARGARAIRHIMHSWVGETLIDFEEAVSGKKI